MAAPIRWCMVSTIRAKSSAASRKLTYAQHALRRERSTGGESDAERIPRVGFSQDEKTILLWHPKPKFPYEHSKPLPRDDSKLAEGDSVLQVQHLMSDKYRYKSTGPTISELSGMFFTTKHRWYPKPNKKYKKRNPPKDRDGL